MRRAFARATIALVVAAGAIVLGEWMARSLLEEALSRRLGVAVSIGRILLDARGDVLLDSVQIGHGAGAATVERVDVDPDARRVLQGELVLNEIALTGLHTNIEAAGSGEPAWPRIGALASARRLFEGKPRVVVRELRVVSGVLGGAAVGLPALRVDRAVARQVPTVGNASQWVAAGRACPGGCAAGAARSIDVAAIAFLDPSSRLHVEVWLEPAAAALPFVQAVFPGLPVLERQTQGVASTASTPEGARRGLQILWGTAP